MDSFQLARIPRLHFGTGKINGLSALLKEYGPKVVLVTGTKSFLSSYGNQIREQLYSNGFTLNVYTIGSEPSPTMIDEAVNRYHKTLPDVVVAIGGGSVLDAGKAISAMLPLNEGVKSYLEGVGTKIHSGRKIPFIAVPTTAGTGSEATKNAVISEPGSDGYKKSLRHENFVPDVAVIDPSLAVTCPKSVTAASGMDAFTQLLESYLSTTANPITDAMAVEGLKRVAHGLPDAYHNGDNVIARADMALAAYLSGVTLANAGLGAVHGLAGAIGGLYTIPHGVICSALMAAANEVTVQRLRETKASAKALSKYAHAGRIFSGSDDKSDEYYIDFILNLIREWAFSLGIPTLSQAGVSHDDIPKIVQASDSKNNPVKLSKEELEEVLRRSM